MSLVHLAYTLTMGMPVWFQEIGSNVIPKRQEREKIARVQVLVIVFKSGVNSDRHVCVYAASIISLFVSIYSCRPFTIQQDFEGGAYWDELAKICSKLLRAGFWGVARFQGNTVRPDQINLLLHGFAGPMFTQLFLQGLSNIPLARWATVSMMY